MTERVTPVAGGILSALFALIPLSDPDTWWLLAQGKQILQGRIPFKNLFSHTYPDHPWHPTQWLFSALLGIVERFFGVESVSFVTPLFVAAVFALTLDTIRRRAGSYRPWHLLFTIPPLVLALALSRGCFVPRAQLATYLFLALLLNLWERRSPRTPLWFGIVGLLWGNFHSGVAYGLAVPILVTVATALSRRSDEFRTALLSTISFVVCSLLNPNHVHQYTYAFQHLAIVKFLTVNEFAQLRWSTHGAFLIFCAAAAIGIPFRLKRKDSLPLLLFGFFFALLLNGVRFFPEFVIVTLPGIGMAIKDIAERVPVKKRFAVTLILLTISVPSSIYLSVMQFRMTAFFYPFGSGVNWTLVPEGAARFIERYRFAGKMFNDYDQGGYLAWRLFPGRRIFIDGRVPAYPIEFIREYAGAGGLKPASFASYIRKYGIDYAVVRREPFEGGTNLGIRFETIGWPMVYIDGVSCVYVRPGSMEDGNTRAEQFELIDSWAPAKVLAERTQADPIRMRTELSRIGSNQFHISSDFNRFGVAAMVAGDPIKAEEFFRAGIRRFPYPDLRINYGTLLELKGRFGEAREQYLRAANASGNSRESQIARKRLESLPR